MIYLGIQVNIFGSPEFIFRTDSIIDAWLNISFTILWLVTLTNAFNFIDRHKKLGTFKNDELSLVNLTFKKIYNTLKPYIKETDGINEQSTTTFNPLETIEEDIEKLEIKDYVKDFLMFTFSVIKRGKIHEVAAVFTFGREDLIPDMFMPLLEGINSENNELNKLIYYFKRHIEVDGDMHGPMSMEMLSYLCDNDEEKILEAKLISEKALLSRISLWDGIESEIKTKKKFYEKV